MEGEEGRKEGRIGCMVVWLGWRRTDEEVVRMGGG